jgi:hypothetical protein
MEWVLKLEARNGWGDVETTEVGRLERRGHRQVKRTLS